MEQLADSVLNFDTKEIIRGYGGVDSKENLYVEFYPGEWESQFTTDENGDFKKIPMDFVRIRGAGSQDIIDRPATDADRKRFAEKYLRYSEGRRGVEHLEGTPIEDWLSLSREEIIELKAMNFHTIEQVANCPDSNIDKMGFNGHVKRKNAISELKRISEHGVSKKSSKENEELKAENKALSDRLAKLEALIQGTIESKTKEPAKKK